MHKFTGSGDSESITRIFGSKIWKEKILMTKTELKERLEWAIWEAFNVEVSIVFIKDRISVNGIEDKIDELKIYLFMVGYIYAIKTQNQKLHIFKPEVI